jgi:carbonic anhydrase/acetyltransferase-like protein (isoleucine patch superfamily)
MEENLATRCEQMSPSAYIAEGAVVLADVTLEAESSIWFNAVLRGDCAPIRIGARSNVQDCCVIHADYGFPCTIGAGVTIGHGAIVHGATLEDNVLIAMNAVVQNGAVVGANSIIGVNAVVKQGMQIPPGSLVIGVPGKVRRPTSEEEIEMNRLAAAHYVESARCYANQGIGLLGEDVAEEVATEFSNDVSLDQLDEAVNWSSHGTPPQRHSLSSSCRSHGLKPRRFRNRGHNRS